MTAHVLATTWSQRVAAPRPDVSATSLRRSHLQRADARSQLETAIAAGRSVFVCGDLGVGKTTLVDQFTDSSDFYTGQPTASRGHRVEPEVPGSPVWVSVGATREESGTPLGALLNVLPDVSVDPAGPVGAVRRAVLDALKAMAAGRPVVVRIDDAHHLDDLSARVLTGLARQDDVQLVATMRAHLAGQNPWLALWKDDVAERVDLGSVSRPDMDVWVRESLGGVVTELLLHHVWQATHGNPLLLVEVLGEAVSDGTLRREGDVWLWAGEPPVSARLVEIVRAELAGLPAEQRRALELVAAVRHVDRDALERLVPEDVVDALLADGYVTSRVSAADGRGTRQPYLSCAAAYGEVLRFTVSPARRRRDIESLRAVQDDLDQQTGLALVTSVDTALACGVQESGDRIVRAVTASLMAGHCDPAVRIATNALRVLPTGAPERPHLLGGRALAWYFLDHSARAIRDIQQARGELATTPMDPTAAITLLLGLADLVVWIEQYQHEDTAAALAEIERVGVELTMLLGGTLPPPVALHLQVTRIASLGSSGRFAEVREECTELLAGPAGYEADVLGLVPLLVLDLNQRGCLVEAQEVAQKFFGVAQAHADTRPWSVSEIYSVGFLTMVSLGEVDAAEAILGIVMHPDAPFNVEPTSTNLMRGAVDMLRGKWSDAREHLRAANAQLAISDVIGLSSFSYMSEALMAFATGDPEGGRELLEKADLVSPRMYSSYMSGEIRLQRITALSWMRDPSTYDESVALADWAGANDLARVELDAVHRAVFALAMDGKASRAGDLAARARALAERIDGQRAQALLAHIEALAAGDQDMLLVSSHKLGECGVWLPPSQRSVTLTRREQEIASLAAGGLSSREIADRLVLSVRTVDSHLSRIFSKAGVRNRRELGVALRGSAG